jgi:hypothetical protein
VIVISGALVLVALVLLIIGLVSTALGFVYASIAVSVVSFAFLLVGIMQRRGEQLPESAAGAPAPAAAGTDVEGVTAIIPSSSRLRPAAEPAASADAEAGSGATVLIVAGRPRYHVDGCRYLTGKEAESVPVEKARADGFTACGVCKPDDAPAAEPVAPVSVPEVAPDPFKAARKTTAKAPAKAATRSATKAPAKSAAPSARKAAAPAKKAAAKAPAQKAAAAKAPAKKATAAKAPAKKAAAKAPAKASKAAAKKSTRR